VLAADVVAVGLRDGAQSDLADLRPAAHDDDALAVDALEGLDRGDAADDRQRAQVRLQAAGARGHARLEVGAAVLGPALEDLDEGDVGAVPGQHAAELVEHAGAGDGLHEEPQGLGGAHRPCTAARRAEEIWGSTSNRFSYSRCCRSRPAWYTAARAGSGSWTSSVASGWSSSVFQAPSARRARMAAPRLVSSARRERRTRRPRTSAMSWTQ